MIENPPDHREAAGENNGDMEGRKEKKLSERLAQERGAENDEDDNACPKRQAVLWISDAEPQNPDDDQQPEDNGPKKETPTLPQMVFRKLRSSLPQPSQECEECAARNPVTPQGRVNNEWLMFDHQPHERGVIAERRSIAKRSASIKKEAT